MISSPVNTRTETFFTLQYRRRGSSDLEFCQPYYHSGETYSDLDDAIAALNMRIWKIRKQGADIVVCYGTEVQYQFEENGATYSMKLHAYKTEI